MIRRQQCHLILAEVRKSEFVHNTGSHDPHTEKKPTMNDAEEKLHRAVALFRCGLIANLIHLPPGTPGIQDRLRAKAEHQYTIPGTLRTRVAAETLRDWLLHYRRGGFDALYPSRVPIAVSPAACRPRPPSC